MSTSDVVLHAVLRAVERNVDLINLSLGSGSRPFSDDPLSALTSRINRQRHTFIAVAAGNNGRNGTWSAAAPDGGGPDTYAVGSFEPEYSFSILRPGQAVVGNKNSEIVDLTWNAPTWTAWFNNSIPESIEIVALSENRDVSQDGCGEITPNPTLYRDKMVLIRRGGCSLKNKMHNLAQAGGQFVLVYDNQPGPVFDLEIRLDGITGGGSVSSETGNMLLSLLKENSEVRLRLDANLTLPPVITWQTNLQTAGEVSTFSEWGPSGEGYTVASLLGPGGRVLSTIPRKLGSWGLQSGTSMAVPYFIGCIALLKEAFPDVDSRTIAETLVRTAEPVNFNDGTNATYNFLASVWQQGAGRVQAYNAFKALQTKVHVSETSLHFNDTEFSNKKLSFMITNDGQEAFRCSISSRPAVTVLSFPSTHRRPVPMTPALKIAEATTDFLETLKPLDHAGITISVAGSGTETSTSEASEYTNGLSLAVGQSVTVTITPDTSPLEASRDRCPLYSGFIDIQSTSGLLQSVSYAGIACQVRSLHTLPDQGTTFLAAVTREDAYMAKFEGRQLAKAPTGTIFTLPRLQHQSDWKVDPSLVLPTIQVDMSMYSRVIRLDLISATDEYQSTPLFTTDVTHRKGGYGRVETHFFHWTGILPNGTWASPGEYRIRISPLRLYGDADSISDYRDIVITDTFFVDYASSEPDSVSLDLGYDPNSPCLEGIIELV
ncbi:hypothetical protein ACET3X_004719 [Alternaria dauci]|uniref:Uncharacterized protein n=1 Tax=Alternaria dauci TaxID=48095 RepID=A0ABR3UIK0_9PLEO